MDVLLNNHNDDPNRLWVEIDRGIRSKEASKRFEAILKMPGLFKKETTSSTVISAALMKLAALFQDGTNEMRLNVTKILDRIASQLQKSSTFDEPIKPIYSVMHSNDCIARALSLRALGIMAHILADDVEAHLHIRSALDSNDEIEILAAIKAAKKFIPCSKTFAMSISTKLVSLVEDLTTPLTIKSWLIPLFEHMTHDATVSMKGRQLLISLIKNDTTEEFLRVAVPTLTRLAVKSHIEIGETVTFFLKFLQLESRENCRKLILHYLIPMARCGSIVWLDSTTDDLIQFAINSNDNHVRVQVLRLIEVLINGGGYLSATTSTNLKQFLEMFIIHDNLSVAYQCCSTTLRIVLKYRNSDELVEQLNTALAVLMTEFIQTNNIKELQKTLNLVEQLSRIYQSSAQNFIHLLFITCTNVQMNSLSNPELLTHVTQSLVRLSTNHIQIIKNETSQLCRLLSSASLNDDVRYNLLALFVLSNPNNTNEIHEHVKKLSSWKCFLLARWCIRHCLYKLAIDLLQILLRSVHVSTHRSWIETILAICQAEERLQSIQDLPKNNLENLCEILAEAGSFYESSLIQMPTKLTIDDEERIIDTIFDFERAYCDVRSSIIHQFYELIYTIYQYDLGMISFDLLSKRMLTIIGKRFTTICTKINDRYQSCFDGDSQTLWCLTFNRFVCDLISTVIERIIRNTPIEKTIWQDRLNEMSWRDGFTEEMFNRLQCILEFACNQLQTKKTVKKHIDEELAVLQYLASSLVTMVPSIPRMFFQKLQQTVVKLIVSPNENEDRPIHESDALLPVQIHGEIDASYHHLPLRTVKQVFVEIVKNQDIHKKTKNKTQIVDQITQESSYGDTKAGLFSDNENVILNQELKENRFHAGFILHLGNVTNYNIHIRVSFEDNNGQRWTNVAEKTICIKLNNRRQARTSTATRPSIQQPTRPTGVIN